MVLPGLVVSIPHRDYCMLQPFAANDDQTDTLFQSLIGIIVCCNQRLAQEFGHETSFNPS